jgi:hypothetical protein
MKIFLHQYQGFWKCANDCIACYPDSLSLATMTSGSCNDYIAEVDCLLTCIQLSSGYAPKRWKKCVNIMILKKAGINHLFCTIVLFPVDCNYTFKFIGWEMMKKAEQGMALAPEQYSSCQHQQAQGLYAPMMPSHVMT